LAGRAGSIPTCWGSLHQHSPHLLTEFRGWGSREGDEKGSREAKGKGRERGEGERRERKGWDLPTSTTWFRPSLITLEVLDDYCAI